jgi:hypothetical protein
LPKARRFASPTVTRRDYRLFMTAPNQHLGNIWKGCLGDYSYHGDNTMRKNGVSWVDVTMFRIELLYDFGTLHEAF